LLRVESSRVVSCRVVSCPDAGGVPEWPIGAVLKTAVGSNLPWVRIPPPPLRQSPSEPVPMRRNPCFPGVPASSKSGRLSLGSHQPIRQYPSRSVPRVGQGRGKSWLMRRPLGPRRGHRLIGVPSSQTVQPAVAIRGHIPLDGRPSDPDDLGRLLACDSGVQQANHKHPFTGGTKGTFLPSPATDRAPTR
jgi:hypothetical protein